MIYLYLFGTCFHFIYVFMIIAKYALRDAGITRNVLIDREGKIVKLTRLYNEEEFASLVQQINEMLK